MKKGGFIKRKKRINVVGHSEPAVLKAQIQALLRTLVMKRDKGCILRMERCGHELDTPGIVFQADHLITRANSATYADARLVVCVCKNCHGWKVWHKEEYDALLKEILPLDTVKLWERCERDSWKPHRMGSYDWKLAIIDLENQIKKL